MTDKGAPLAYDTIGVRLVPDGRDWLVHTDITFRAERQVRGEVVLDLSASPLSLERVDEGAVATRSDVDPREIVPLIELRLDDPETHAWHALTVTMTFRWSPGGVPPGRNPARGYVEWEAPCLVLPDMMPALLVKDDLIYGPRSDVLPRVVLREVLPPTLSLGWIGRGGDRSESPPEDMLQAIIFPTEREAPPGAPLAVLRDPRLKLSVGQREQARAFAAPLLPFLEQELGCAGLVHPVLYLSDRPAPPLYPSGGGYATILPDHAGAVKLNVGRPPAVIHQFTQGWFGGGVRISGENKLDLAIGIGGALGLRWLQAHRYVESLDRTIRRSEEAIEEARRTKEWRTVHRALELQLSLFRGFEAPKARETIRALLREHWGSYLPQERLVDALRRAGVAVPGVYM